MLDSSSLGGKVPGTEQTAYPLFRVDRRRRIKLRLFGAGVFPIRHHAGHVAQVVVIVVGRRLQRRRLPGCVKGRVEHQPVVGRAVRAHIIDVVGVMDLALRNDLGLYRAVAPLDRRSTATDG